MTTTLSTGVAREGRPAQPGRPSRFYAVADNVVDARSRSVTVESDGVALPGDLTIPGQSIAVLSDGIVGSRVGGEADSELGAFEAMGGSS